MLCSWGTWTSIGWVGLWAGPTDVIFDRHTVLEPDLMVALGPEARKLRYWKDLPDPALVIEILSPSSAKYDRGAKRERYLRRAAEYWIVDLDSRLIERWRPGDDRPVIAQDKIAWQPVPSVPPLLIDVEAVFAELPDEESPHRPTE